MTEIVNHNAEENPRLNEIYEILLLAGYFRIRIASLKAFDKLVGGLAWCITCSHFEIEVEYNDEMQIGQKIKVAERVCEALETMNCPHSLSPFQLQGIDAYSIFPIAQWLVKQVYDTRLERQYSNQETSLLLLQHYSFPIHPHRPFESLVVLRLRRNVHIKATSCSHPIRVYSALLEFGHVSALKLYNSLHNFINKNRMSTTSKENFVNYLHREEEEQSNNMNDFERNNHLGINKLNMFKINQLIEENKNSFEEGIKENNNIEGISEEQEQTDPLIEKIHRLQKQKGQLEVQIAALFGQFGIIETKILAIEEEKKNLYIKKEEIFQQNEHEKLKIKERENKIQEIEEELKGKNAYKLGLLVEKKKKLKQTRAEIKKKAKERLEELSLEREAAEASIPEVDEEAFSQLVKMAEAKKEVFERKYVELTELNRELTVMQREAERWTSAAEVAQYHQRFVALFEEINCAIEGKRSMFSEQGNLEGVKQLATNYAEFLTNSKDSLKGLLKREEKRELAENFSRSLASFQTNQINSQRLLNNLKKQREASYASYLKLIDLENSYFLALRHFKAEYDHITSAL